LRYHAPLIAKRELLRRREIPGDEGSRISNPFFRGA
jgi:hypothetical protein